MSEKPKRLAPKTETLRELFLKSGNLCAYPGCGALMMNVDGVFIGQLCHIEAAEEGGERFNPQMTNEDRRHISNLILMCYPHHEETNNVGKYPVAKIRQFKNDHEKRFARADRAILEKLIDWTTLDEPIEPRSLTRMNTLLGWGHGPEELEQSIAELNAYVANLRRVPIDLRRFLGAVAGRAQRMQNTRVVQTGMFGTKILVSDVKSAFNLSEHTVAERTNQLDAYDLADIDEIDTDLGPKPAIRIRDLKSGWPFWLDLADFCEKAQVSMDVFTDEMDFSRLD